MLRFSIIAVSLVAFLALPAIAQDNPKGEASAQVEVAPQKKLTAAQRRADEIDKLFAELQKVDALSGKAKSLEDRIVATWARSDSVTAELILSQSGKAMTADEFDAALQMLNELIAVRPGYAEAYNKRASLYFRMRRYEQSLADLDKVLDIEPRHFGALSGRGMIFEKQGKPDQALDAFREALRMNPHMALVRETIKVLEKERPAL